jgi:hypothetical protein
MKLFGHLGRAHTPDIDALSALVDGALDAPQTAALEAHIVGCERCAAELEGLRRVKTMLAALPQVEPARSFRVRPADVGATDPRTMPAGGLIRAMPALAAAAAVVFVGVLATDFSTRDADSERQASSGPAAESARALEMDSTMQSFGDDDSAAGAAPNTFPFASEITRTAAAEAPDVADADASPSDGAAGAIESGDEATGGGVEADGPEGDGPAGEDAAAAPPVEMEQVQAANARSADDDDDSRNAYLIAEIAAGAVAVAAAAAFIINRRSEGTS